MKIKKIILIMVGCLSLVAGAIGVIVPLLPAFPFLLLASVCFGKSSEKLNMWFKSTKMYKNNLESYVKGEGMSKKTKTRIILMITVLLSIGFIMMYHVPLGQILLVIVWIGHILYFCVGVKTLKAKCNF